jgi:hypothetical protein
MAFKPVVDGEEYYTRKQQYAVAAMVVCDDYKRIRYLNVGWPGSVHDQRIYQNSKINRQPQLFFLLRNIHLENQHLPIMHGRLQHTKSLVVK